MNKIQKTFFNIDTYIFSKIDLLKSSTAFAALTEKISKLDDRIQKIINQLIAMSVIIVPLIATMFLIILNFSLKGNVEVKNKILSTINELNSNQSDLSQIEKTFYAPEPINSNQELSSKITNILASKGIALSNISVSNFISTSPEKNIGKIEADFNFNHFTTSNLSDFLKLILEKEKMRITRFNIKKEKKDNTLSGTFHIEHYSKR